MSESFGLLNQNKDFVKTRQYVIFLLELLQRFHDPLCFSKVINFNVNHHVINAINNDYTKFIGYPQVVFIEVMPETF